MDFYTDLYNTAMELITEFGGTGKLTRQQVDQAAASSNVIVCSMTRETAQLQGMTMTERQSAVYIAPNAKFKPAAGDVLQVGKNVYTIIQATDTTPNFSKTVLYSAVIE